MKHCALPIIFYLKVRRDCEEIYKICLNQQSKNHVLTNAIYKY